ncbi:hypothetical protein ACRAWG_06330 [Methylobacterium sp. P31]
MTHKEWPDSNIPTINVTNSCSIDVLRGHISVSVTGDHGAKIAAFSFVNAGGGFDSKDLRLEGKPGGIHAEFELINDTRIEADVKFDDINGRVANIVLTE